jgi:glycogen synthase
MRVLMFSWEYPPIVQGGLGRHVAGLVPPLAAGETEVALITRGDTGDEDRGGLAVRRVASRPFPPDPVRFLAWVEQLNRGLRRRGEQLADDGGGFDLVHSHDWLVAGAARAVARRRRLPWVVTVHATEHGRHRGWVQRHPQSAIHAAERAMARDADRLITCSSAMARHVSAVYGLPASRVTTIANGVDSDRLGGPAAGARGAVQRARHAPRGERLVLLAGRLMYEKGFHLALEALAGVVGARRDAAVRFVVAGAGMAEADLRHQARRLGIEDRGSFLGWVEDATLHGLMHAADLCVVPSLFEPFGIVALEALACGCPVVAADTGGLREIVPGDERVGVRVRPGDPGALATAIARLLDDEPLRARMAAAGPAWAAAYDWGEVAELTREVYAQVLAPAPARV